MNGDFDVANGVAAGQVANGVPGEEKEPVGLAGRFAQMSQGAPLIG